jgi:hypothetical protein
MELPPIPPLDVLPPVEFEPPVPLVAPVLPASVLTNPPLPGLEPLPQPHVATLA